MLYLAYPAPHTPWLPSEPFLGKSGAGMYGDFVNMVDHQIGQVMAALEKSGMADETLVILTADNGPVWFDVDTEKFGHDSAGGLRGIKAGAWEGGHRMPFIVRWPEKVKANSVTHQTVCFTDIFATLADLVGTDIPTGQAPDSESFLPVLTGDQPEEKAIRGPIVMAAGRKHFMVRSGDWKLIDGPESGGFSNRGKKADKSLPRIQLYNLREDLAETTNLQADQPEKVAELKSILDKIKKQNN